jgi:hypothetical protein
MNSAAELTEPGALAVPEVRESTGPRETRHNSPYRVFLHGLKFFCSRLPAAFASEGWDILHHHVRDAGSLAVMLRDLRAADLVFRWGSRISLGKFLRAVRFLNKKNVVFFWSGSDVLGAQQQFSQGICEPWIAAKTHWAGAPWLRDEIQALGLRCEFVPITWVPAVEAPESLPNQFSVLAYLPNADHAELYGLKRILEVARSLPQISFELVGLTSGSVADPPSNLRINGRTSDMAAVYRRSTLYWRPVAHDGLSFMSLEALAHGRHVLWSYPFPHCRQSRNAEQDRAEILGAFGRHQRSLLGLNESGIRMVKERFSLEIIRKDYLRRWEDIIAGSRHLS